jgi:hypothetical protein
VNESNVYQIKLEKKGHLGMWRISKQDGAAGDGPVPNTNTHSDQMNPAQSLPYLIPEHNSSVTCAVLLLQSLLAHLQNMFLGHVGAPGFVGPVHMLVEMCGHESSCTQSRIVSVGDSSASLAIAVLVLPIPQSSSLHQPLCLVLTQHLQSLATTLTRIKIF